jgi:death on curing protein
VTEPVFLGLEVILVLHDEQLRAYGGGQGLRDQGLLESAVAMPRASFGGVFVHEDVYAMAAAYAFHIAQNHPFVDGNKRTGLHAALHFLDVNGSPISRPDDRLYDAMIAVAEGRLDKAGLAALFRELASCAAT